MKRWLLHILCIGVFGMLAASCNQIIDDPIADGDCKLETEEVKVTFTIAMGNPDSGSRADISSNDPWGNFDEENENETMGNRYFDNKIEPNKLQVLICEEDCTPIVKVKKLLYTQTETNVYTFTGSFVANMLPATKYKIMVFANCPEVGKSSTWNDYLPFTMPESGNTEALTSIPMWGVKTVNGVTFTAGTNTNIGTIFVLRAMAKVEIALADEIAEEYALTSASFNTYNTKVNCIPSGYAEVEKTELLNTVDCFNDNDISPSEGLAFMNVEEGKRMVAYVPEYDNDKGLLEMKVILSGSEYTIPFNDIKESTPFDVIRNHYYEYTITGVNEEIDVEVTSLFYQTQDWTTKPSVNIEYN